MIDLLEIIKSRRSIRRFKDNPVSRDDLIKILEAARWAPSAANSQPWHFVVIEKKSTVQDMARAVRDVLDRVISETKNEKIKRRLKTYKDIYYTLFENAPLTIAVFIKPYHSSTEDVLRDCGFSDKELELMRPDPGLQSVAAAIQNILLSAHSLGYGSCWMTGPVIAYHAIERILDAKKDLKLVALVPMGTPDESPPLRPRKELDDIVTFID